MALLPSRITPRSGKRRPAAPVVPTTNTRLNPGGPAIPTGANPNQTTAPGGMAGRTGTVTRPQPRAPGTSIGGFQPPPGVRGPTLPPGVGRVNNPPPASPPTPTDPNAGKSQEDLYDQALRELLGNGPRNTAEDEAHIQQMLQQTVGQGQADLNARLGAAGFGTSGALGAQSADMRSQAAREAAGEVMGVRGDARQEYFDRIQAGLSGANADRSLDIREDAYSRYLDALEKALGMEPAPEAGGPVDLPGDPEDAIGGVVDPDGNGVVQVPGLNERPGFDGEGATATAGDDATQVSYLSNAEAAAAVDSAPDGYEATGQGRADHNGNRYTEYSNGTDTVWVRE